MKVLNYRVLFRKEPEGGYTVTVPSLSGCVTYGETIEESVSMAKEAIELYVENVNFHTHVNNSLLNHRYTQMHTDF